MLSVPCGTHDEHLALTLVPAAGTFLSRVSSPELVSHSQYDLTEVIRRCTEYTIAFPLSDATLLRPWLKTDFARRTKLWSDFARVLKNAIRRSSTTAHSSNATGATEKRP